MRFVVDYDCDEMQDFKRKPTGCACFGPGECSGSCPGRDLCPMCQDNFDEDEESEDEDD